MGAKSNALLGSCDNGVLCKLHLLLSFHLLMVFAQLKILLMVTKDYHSIKILTYTESKKYISVD